MRLVTFRHDHGVRLGRLEGTEVLDLAAAAIKAQHPMAYADAFALAMAAAHGVPLLTGDPEIIDAGVDVEVVDLR